MSVPKSSPGPRFGARRAVDTEQYRRLTGFGGR